MLKLKPLGNPKSVPFETMPEKLEFKSLDGRYSIVFHSVKEIRMSHYVWKISLFEGEVDITHSHLLEDQKFFLPIYYSSLLRSYYAPWGYQSDILCLYYVTTDLEIITKFYSISKKTFVIPPLQNTTTLLCSPHSSDVLTLSYESQISNWSPYVVDLDGTVKKRIPFSGTPLDIFTSWITPFPWFIVVVHEPEGKKTNLYFYDEITEVFQDKIQLEPSEFVPFNKNRKFTGEFNRRAPSALKSLAYGDFLNKWDEIGIDWPSNTLILRYVRPSSGAFTEDGLEYVNIKKYEIKFKIIISEE